MKRKLGLTAVCVLVMAICLTSVPNAPAQTAGEPQQAAPTVDVQRVLMPATRAKLLRLGVRVQASCTPNCVLVVKLKVSPTVASKLGIRSDVIGFGARAADGEGVPTFVRARIRPSLRERVANYPGTANLRIQVTALP